LNDDALEALREAYTGRQSQFVVERGAQQVKSIKKAFQAASARSGIHVTPYTLRHTGAVWAAEAGVSMAELAQFMGHDDSATTEKHYARFSPGHLRRVADAVQRRAK
jgi:integrase